jgi:hypothetical protein
MKTIKLILVFIVVMAIVVGAFLLASSGNSGSSKSYTMDDVSATYAKEFEDKWKEANDWDYDLFMQNHSTINILSKDHSVETLRDLNTLHATMLVHDKLIAEWKKSSCSEAKVSRYMQAIDTITKYDRKAASDNNIKELRRINSVYRRALTLARSNIGLQPQFSPPDQWNSFEKYKERVMAERSSILGNSDYREYLQNITHLHSSLNAIEGKMTTARKQFYDHLADRIKSYYNSCPRTNANLISFGNARNKYEKEAGNTNILRNFALDFRDEVQRSQLNKTQ